MRVFSRNIFQTHHIPAPARLGLAALALFAALAGLTPAVAGAEVEITSSFSPPNIREGRETRYTITIRRTSDGAGSLNMRPQVNAVMPSVAGLDTTYIGPTTSTQTTFSNVTGTRRILTLTLNYRVSAAQRGSYTIPAFPLTYDGQDYEVPPATLEVVEAGESGGLGEDQVLFLELLLPEHKIFVGQAIKATLQLYALDRIPNIRTNYPVKIGDAFAEGSLADSQTRSRGRANDYDYNIYSRPLTLTPLKSGRQSLIYEMEVQALMPTDGDLFGNSGNDDSPSPFNDPLFRRFNFQLNPQMQYQNILVSTAPIQIEVQPLPSKGRPEDFSGAIGEFSLKAFPDTNQARAGDPINMRIQLAGQGNFDRILPPEVDLGNKWKSYEPEVSFKQGDTLGFTGIKTFDYTLIPLDPEIEVIPEISISYFDPKTERYEILSTGEVPVTIEENPDMPSGDPAPPVTGPLLADQSGEETPSFFNLRLEPGSFHSSMRPLFSNPWFLASQGVPLLAFIAFVGIRRHQIRVKNDENRRRRKEIDQRLQELSARIGETVRANQPGEFYHLALQALRLVLSKRFRSRATSATRAEIPALIRECGLDDGITDTVEALFAADEALNYARTPGTSVDLPAARKELETLISRIDQAV